MRIITPIAVFLLAVFHCSTAGASDCKISPGAACNLPVCTATNGVITMNPANGTAPYIYRWSNGATTATISHLAPGSYTVTVTDAAACTVARMINLTANVRTMSASAAATGDTCAAHIGKVSVTVTTGGNAPFKYVWSNGGTVNPITSLGAHYYTVTVTDSNGCSATAGASVSNIGTPIAINGGVTQPLCYGNAGSANITATGGTGNTYSALWSNGSTGFNISNLQAANYTVTVSGNNGCYAVKSYTINAKDSIALKFRPSNINCDSGSGGSITLTGITGAVSPWSCAWSGPNGFTSANLTINHLNAGNYTLSLTDAHGCSSRAAYVISSSGLILPKYVVTNTSCPGVNNGAIGRQSLSPYSSPVYTWRGPGGFTSDSCSLRNLAAGIYNLTISEGYGCIGTLSDTVKQGAPIAVTYTVKGVKCDSAIGGSITNTGITGATYPWTASWTGANGFTSNSVNLNKLTQGQYHLNFTDASGCTATGNYTVDSSGALTVNYATNNIYCSTNNGSVVFQSLSPYSNLATYSWTGSNGFTSSGKGINGLSAGNYSVTVTEDFGCKATKNFAISSSFDVGVVSIKYVNSAAPGQNIIIHPIAGDMSQVNGLHCAAGINGQVQMIVTGPVHYAGTAQGGLTLSSVHGDTITWNVPNFGTLRIDSSFFVVMNIDSNAVPGVPVCIYVSVTPLAGDNNPQNNAANTCMMVIRPFDPNEKVVSPDGNIEVTQKELTYTILFQNTGTAAAQNVVVLDTLDGHVDPATFKVLASSFPVQSSLTGNAIRFSFPGINLPDSGTDANGSRGWVQYRVGLRDNLSLGTEISNTAYIIFDFNSPVVTNTTVNRIGLNAGAPGSNPVAEGTAVILSPNPAHLMIHLKAGRDAVGGRFEMIDALGRKCLQGSIVSNEFDVPLSGIAQGMYLVNIIDSLGNISTHKLMVE